MQGVSYAAVTDVGQVREHNEDAILAEQNVFVVADGMGGHAAGEVAAALAVEQFAVLAGRADLRPEDLVQAVAKANEAILSVAARRGETAGMGTTVAGVCLGEDDGTVCWLVFGVGDSRVYRYGVDGLAQVTVDHSEVEELIEAGRLSPEDARYYPRRNVVTRSLGSDPAPTPDVWVLPAVPADRFLVCSDGLTGEVRDDEIAAIVEGNPDPQAAADELVAHALAAGGHDNVSVIVVDLPAGKPA